MIELHSSPTPNGQKVMIMLEETGLEWKHFDVLIRLGEQFKPEFLKINPNAKVPAIVDHEPGDGGGPLSIFESGAILEYLAMKTSKFLPSDVRGRAEVMQWLFWQMGGLGPMLGQNHHFRGYAAEKITYAIERYTKETERLYGVLDRRLADREFVADNYSIADISIWPWVSRYEWQTVDLNTFPNVKRWYTTIAKRPAVQKGYKVPKDVGEIPMP